MNGQPGSVNGDAGRMSGGTRPADPQEVTQLLADWSQGDAAALEKLTPLVYEELRRLAHHYMEAQRPDPADANRPGIYSEGGYRRRYEKE